MGKYLCDIYIHAPQPPSSFSKEEERKFYADNQHLWAALRLIADLYNTNFPVKYSTPDGEWRMFIYITTDPNLDITQQGFESWFYLDIESLRGLSVTNRKLFLFNAISPHIIALCKKKNYSYVEFAEVNKLIAAKNVLFDEPHGKWKYSKNRQWIAAIWRKYDEFETATYIRVTDREGVIILFKKIEDFHFSIFDRIEWQDDKTFFVYKFTQYGICKKAEDYYEVSINGNIRFRPQTSGEIFHYGLQLMKQPEKFSEGVNYVKVADGMGYGKARNVMLNLRINPDETDTEMLIRQPGKQKLKNL